MQKYVRVLTCTRSQIFSVCLHVLICLYVGSMYEHARLELATVQTSAYGDSRNILKRLLQHNII